MSDPLADARARGAALANVDSVVPANVSRQEYEARMQTLDQALNAKAGAEAVESEIDRLDMLNADLLGSLVYHHRMIWALVVAQFVTCTVLFTVLR